MGKIVKLSKEANEAMESGARIRKGLKEALEACDHYLDSFQVATKNQDQGYHDRAMRGMDAALRALDAPVKDHYRRFVLVGDKKQPARGRWGRFVYAIRKFLHLTK